MLVNSVVSIYYYFMIPRQMIFTPPEDRARMPVPALVTGVVTLATAALVILFLFPNPIAHVADLSTLSPLG